jgi:hypothetical protein
MSLFHCHHFGAVQPDGYQYCQGCGRAVVAPKTPPNPCQHEWKLIERVTLSDYLTNQQTGTIRVLQCNKCGDMKDHET